MQLLRGELLGQEGIPDIVVLTSVKVKLSELNQSTDSTEFNYLTQSS